MVDVWDEHFIGKAPAIFDPQKLRYINAEYIRALTPDAFYEKAAPYIDEAVHCECDRRLLASVLQQRCEVLSDIPARSTSSTRCRTTTFAVHQQEDEDDARDLEGGAGRAAAALESVQE